MKKLLSLLCGFMLLSFNVYAQHTFNKQYYFDGIAAIGNGIHVTDSCYYISGLVVDTINGGIYDGLIFGKLSLDGELEEYRLHLDSLSDYENWHTPLMFHEDKFTSVGFGTDSVMYLYWMQFNEAGEILTEKKHRSPFSPDDWFIHPHGVHYTPLSKRYYITSEVGYYLPSGVLNGEFSVSCLDSLGNQLWDQTYGDGWMDNPSSLVILTDSTLAIGGMLANYNLTSLNKIYKTQITAIDTTGETIWGWTSPNDNQQGANDMIVEEDGSLIIVSGRGFLEYVNVSTRVILWDRGLIFKLNEDQEVEWETELEWGGRNFTNRLTRIVHATDGHGYVAAGTVAHPYSPGPGGRLGYLTKVNTVGDSIWGRRLFYYEASDSTGYEHYIHDLQTTPDGGYFMSGYTLDREGLQEPPRQRAWFIKVDSEGCLIPGCGLVDAEEPTEEGPPLLLYPNPATEHLNVYLGDGGGQRWQFLLFDAAGRQLGSYAAPTPHTTYVLPVQDYPAGTYYLQVADERGRRLKSYTWVKGK